MPEHLLEIAGQKIAAQSYNEQAAGAPIVFIHGITASIDMWRHCLPNEIRNGRYWISLSLPGHAPSRLPENFVADDVTAEMFDRVHIGAIRQLVGDRPVALVGWSTGGFSALNLAARHPESVTSVMSIAGFAHASHKGVITRMQRLVRKGRSGRRAFQFIWSFLGNQRWAFDLALRQGAVNRAEYRRSPITRTTLDGWQQALRNHDLERLATLFERLGDIDIRDLLPGIQVPTLIVGGDRDPYVPLDHTQVLAESIPDAELIIWPGVGHMFFSECTIEFQRLLCSWLEHAEAFRPDSTNASHRLNAGGSPPAERPAETANI